MYVCTHVSIYYNLTYFELIFNNKSYVLYLLSIPTVSGSLLLPLRYHLAGGAYCTVLYFTEILQGRSCNYIVSIVTLPYEFVHCSFVLYIHRHFIVYSMYNVFFLYLIICLLCYLFVSYAVCYYMPTNIISYGSFSSRLVHDMIRLICFVIVSTLQTLQRCPRLAYVNIKYMIS